MIITSIVVGEKAFQELCLQLFTVAQWHKDELPTYYIFTDSNTLTLFNNAKKKDKDFYKGPLKLKVALDAYAGKDRRVLERMKGETFLTRWTDLMCEKINCIRWAFEDSALSKANGDGSGSGGGQQGVFFMDSDITLLAPMPTIPEGTDLALSPHHIKKVDCDKYGHYNGGFGWIGNVSLCSIWEEHTVHSRFFEQAALENVAEAAKSLYIFPFEYNFGWWRVYQHESLEPIQMFNKMGVHRGIANTVGITFDGKAIHSIHCHFTSKDDFCNRGFYGMIYNKLALLRNHPPAVALLAYMRRRFF